MRTHPKKRAYATTYQSQNQLALEGFESPFDQKLRSDNRWVVLANLIPWDEIVGIYLKHVPPASTGRPSLSPRIVIGSLIIKHLCNLDDRETVDQISENMYMQYFLGFTSFSNEPPFDPSLFVEFRKRIGMDQVNAINEKIAELHFKKPRTYRKKARKFYLHVAQMKKKSNKDIRKANGQQLRFVKRDIQTIHSMLDVYEQKKKPFPLSFKELRYFWIVQTLYNQQKTMYDHHARSIEHRIVSIHQPHGMLLMKGIT